MTEYQLEIKQHVEYPRCRIYKKFVEMLMCDPDIKTSGGLWIVSLHGTLQFCKL